MIEILRDPKAAERWCRAARQHGPRLGFVPTMGALHDGHHALVRRAAALDDAVCASVFVNPLQFDERADFERYQRDFEGDARLLESAGCRMVFTGTLGEFFPGDVQSDGSFDPAHLVDPGPCALGLEGALRPGHFAGVATIVRRLFELVEPTSAYFGQKDFQQTLVVEHLARVRGRPAIVVCPTVREPSGLARSSRNEFLSPTEREHAAELARSLARGRATWERGERDAGELAAAVRQHLERERFTIGYATVRDPERWTADEPVGRLERAVALVAVRIGNVRLIDNRMLHTADGAA
jgi:pantoate--beta-alanine ligase